MDSRLDYPAAVGAAVRAPSLHNSQPWRFRLRFTASERSSEASDAAGSTDVIEVRLDPQRRLPATDPTGWAARLAVGAVVLNLRLALAAQGWEPRVRLMPDRSEPYLLADVGLGRQRPATPVELRLCQAIWHRHSNRSPFWPDEVPADVRAKLVAAAAAEDAWLALLIGPGPVNALAEIARTANQVLMRSAAYRAELAAWTRGSRAVTDGVPADAGGPRPEPQDLLPQRPFSDRPRGTGHDFEPQPLVAVLGTVNDTPGDQLVAGQALQRVLLTAADARLAVSMVSQPIEVARAREQIRLALHQFGVPQMVLRIGYGQPGQPTPRRPVEDFIDQEAVAEAVREP
jgi:nitroreductase